MVDGGRGREVRKLQRAHALGRQEQRGQQLRRRVRQQRRRQGARGPWNQSWNRAEQIPNTEQEVTLPRATPQVAGRRSTLTRCAASCRHSRCGAAEPSAAHPELSSSAGRVRRREQLGQRREQRPGSRRDRLDGADLQQYEHRVPHRLRAGGRVGD